MNKKLLMISYSFPPKGGGGVLRQLKFAKYLPEFGWQVYILCGDKFFFFKDNGLLEELHPESRLVRINWPDPRNLFKRKDQAKKEVVKLNDRSSGFFPNLARIINKISVPDIYLGWAFLAAIKGYQLLKREDIKYIYSIDYPCSNHVAGFLLKKLTGLRWIADFKDPWTKSYGHKANKIFPFNWLDYRLEKLILKNADQCLVSDERIARILKHGLSSSDQSKFSVIPNGYDEADFDQPENSVDDIFTISHVGTIYKDMPPDNFLTALLELIKEGKISGNKVKIVFVGAHDYEVTRQSPSYQQLLEKGILDEKGLVSHKESIACMNSSAALLLINDNAPDSANIILSKLYEYLGSGKVIIALAPGESRVAKIMEDTKSGYLTKIDDKEGIKQIIIRLYNEFYENGKIEVSDRQDKLEPYKRRNIARSLSGVLSEAITD